MKKLFGLLTFILIGLINFGYCEEYEGGRVGSLRLSAGQTYEVGKGNTNVINMGNNLSFCIFSSDYRYGCDYTATYGGKSVSIDTSNTQYIACITNITISDTVGVSVHNDGNSLCQYGMYQFFPTDELFTQYTSLECQTEYNLIPISNVDQNYCVNNGLCPSGGGDCPGSGDNWSALYINDIQHLGKPIINVTIPDYITWDYTTNENEFNLYCGSGYDEDYINSVIAINSYRPDSGDFTDIFVSGLTLVFPYIVIVLFIVFVRRLLKRIFR